MLSVLYNNNYQFVLTKDTLAIDVEMAHDVRLVPIFDSAQKAQASHKPAVIKPWLGDSVAWWEGNTLVVETTNVNPLQGQNHPFYLTPQGKVTERLTRVSANRVLYQFTVEDPKTWVSPWSGEYEFVRGDPVYGFTYHGPCRSDAALAAARREERERAARVADREREEHAKEARSYPDSDEAAMGFRMAARCARDIAAAIRAMPEVG